MTTQNVSRRLHVRSIAIAAVLTAAVCATTQSANAVPETSSIHVNFSGIDLSTAGGQEKAKERLFQAARLACLRVVDGLDLSAHENYLACVDATLTQAMPKLTQLIISRATVQMAGNAPK